MIPLGGWVDKLLVVLWAMLIVWLVTVTAYGTSVAIFGGDSNAKLEGAFNVDESKVNGRCKE